MLQFKATVWPKVATESTYEALKFQNFLGDHPPDPPSCFCIPYCKRLKAGRGLGTRPLANVVCPRFALASAVFWLRHWCTAARCVKKERNGQASADKGFSTASQGSCHEKWPSQCRPRLFYSQPRQLPCARQLAVNPPTSPYPAFFASAKPIFKTDCTN